MGIDFKTYRGSASDGIVEGTGHRESIGHTGVYVEITHSGVCGTDEHYKHADMALGHEGVGIAKEVGPGVNTIKVGDRVGLGWVRSYCGHCQPCLTGRDSFCENQTAYGTGDTDEGSFGTAGVWDESSLHVIPDGLPSEDAAPLMCGGATVWGPLTQYDVKAGDRVGVIGVGGLGHLAIQFASKMGMEVVVFSSTENKREEAFSFGASEFHATKGVEKFEGVKPLKHLLACGSGLPDFNLYVPIMAATGTIYPLTVDFGKTIIPSLPFLVRGLRLQGSAGAYRSEIAKMMDFCVRYRVGPQNQLFPMTKKGVEDAMQTLREGKMRYRGVLVVEK